MKNTLIKVIGGFALALLLGTGIAYAVNGGDTNVVQRNSANTANITYFLGLPAGSASGILGINGSTTQPDMMLFGNRLSFNTSTHTINMDLTAQPESNITNLTSDLNTLTSAVAGKFTFPGSGTTAQFLDGTGALQTSKTLLSQFTNDAGFITSAPSTTWGSITGTLSSQTDLNTALGLKANTSSLSTVATSGLYSDLLSKPTLFSGAFSALTGVPTTLSGYGITDAYPLSGNPSGFLTSVPAQSFSSLTGKPTTLSGYGITDAYPLTGNPSAFLTSVPAQSFSSLTGKPTTLSGYGITDGVTSTTTVNGHALSSNVTVSASDVGLGNVNNTSDANKPVSTAQAASIATKLTIPSGTTSQVILGNGTLGTLPTGTVTGVTATGPVASSGGTAPVISMAKSTSSVDGYLAATDFATFTAKFNTPTGTASQVVLGNGTLGTLPVIPSPVSSTYQSLVTQTGTAAPTGTAFVNDFSGTTFTWARTSAGVYTLTASNPIFTANKTAVIMSNPPSFLINYKYAVTSSTVITFQTATLSIISLIITPGLGDSLLSNTMVYVVVYP